jgi:hypothetical protein
MIISLTRDRSVDSSPLTKNVRVKANFAQDFFILLSVNSPISNIVIRSFVLKPIEHPGVFHLNSVMFVSTPSSIERSEFRLLRLHIRYCGGL